MAIPVFRPSIKRKDMDAVLTCLVSDQIGPGNYSEDLVHSLLERCDADAGIVLREQLRGMEVLLKSLDCKPGDRVAISALGSETYRFVLEKLGLTPVFIDASSSLPVMNLDLLFAAHESQALSAVILEHPLGYAPDTERLAELGAPIIQDISGILYHSPRPEYIGDFFILNLEPENIITTGGGVFIASAKRKGSKALTSVVDGYPKDIYLPDMNAAMGVIQVRELKGFLEVRQDLLAVLQRSVMESRHKMISVDEQLVPSALPVLLQGSLQDAQHYGVKKQVEIQPAFENSVISAMMRNFDIDNEGDRAPAELYPEAARFALRTVLLPLYPSMGRKEMELLQKVIKTLP